MADVFRVILIMSLTGGVLALFLLIVKPLVRDRLPKSAQYVLWIVVVAALLFPASKLVALPQQLAAAPIQQTVERYAITVEEEMDRLQARRASWRTNELRFGDAKQTLYAEINAVDGTTWISSAMSTVFTFAIVFHPLIAMAVFLAFLLPYWLLLYRLRRTRISTGIQTRVCVYRSSAAATPMLIGVFRPAVYLPERGYGDEQLRNVLAHELTHLRRKDIWVKWLSVFAVSLHWFNPLAWISRREIDRLCELSCDEAVIAKYGMDEKQSYGDTLIAVVAERKLPAAALSTTMGEQSYIRVSARPWGHTNLLIENPEELRAMLDSRRDTSTKNSAHRQS